jgi:hypothetical protein
MNPSTLVRMQWILAWLMPSAYAEALLGDLLEESRLRLQAGSPASVARWYWMQLVWSMPVLLWASLQRHFSIFTLVTAIASYFIAAGVLFLLMALSPMTTSMFLRAVIVLLCGFVAMAAGGFVAALIRPGAARLLAVLVFVTTSVMTAFNTDNVSFWYDGSFVVLGSLAPIAGAALSGRWRRVR